MKRRKLLFIVILIVGCLITWGAQGQRQRSSTWEYKILEGVPRDSRGERKLNELGAAGWELVDVKEEEGGTDRARYYLKRAK